jgi:uncharacterized repeat protein (TIGR03803 family)
MSLPEQASAQALHPTQSGGGGLLLAILIALPLAFCQFSDATPQQQTGTQRNDQTPIRLCLLHGFGATKGEPVSSSGILVQGPAGDDNFYGATSSGGFSNQDTILKISQDGALTILYSFDGKHLGGHAAV